MKKLSNFRTRFRCDTLTIAVFLRDNFNCSAGLAQRRGLAQTLLNYSGVVHFTIVHMGSPQTKGQCFVQHCSQCESFIQNKDLFLMLKFSGADESSLPF